ncbi:MAG TPA: glycoside hydrolase family 15 protein [Gaiellaceae bacterium]|nr:glycoside hydrolase family 15 protein [Gaiellaceae bacterium]
MRGEAGALRDYSVQVLRDGQAPSGAFVAAPSFAVYGFAWLRDGAFCAHAMDVAGEGARARAFHEWAAEAIERQRPRIAAAVGAVRDGGIDPARDGPRMPPTRFTLEGLLERGGDEEWPNFQLDGYGMWLWALREHLADKPLPESLAPAVRLTADYLAATWPTRCYGCWEELDDGEHAVTISAIAAGLRAAAVVLRDDVYHEAADVVTSHLLERFAVDGRFKRGATDERVDGSLVWAGVPFGVLPPDDQRLAATVEAIRRDLVGPGGGVYRYRGDTYYGGGQWILLTCSLGWHAAVVGDDEERARARDWVVRQARANGDLPEQVYEHAQTPAMIAPWIERWGEVATPLLWSHAKYLLMEAS